MKISMINAKELFEILENKTEDHLFQIPSKTPGYHHPFIRRGVAQQVNKEIHLYQNSLKNKIEVGLELAAILATGEEYTISQKVKCDKKDYTYTIKAKRQGTSIIIVPTCSKWEVLRLAKQEEQTLNHSAEKESVYIPDLTKKQQKNIKFIMCCGKTDLIIDNKLTQFHKDLADEIRQSEIGSNLDLIVFAYPKCFVPTKEDSLYSDITSEGKTVLEEFINHVKGSPAIIY